MIALALMTVLSFPTPASAPAPSFEVMTFNIRYGTANDGDNRWEVRRPRTLEALKKRHPAIIGLQEALSFQVEQVRDALPGYQAVGVGREDGKAQGEYSAIVYDAKRFRLLRSDTFWYSDTPNVPNSTNWGNQITRICTWAYFQDLNTKKYFYHYNTHLDHQSQPSREKSAAMILDRIKTRSTQDPVIVTGDFNVGEDNPVATILKQGGLLDSFRVLHPDEKTVGTFNGWKDRGTDKIDYVWVNSGFKVLSAEILATKVKGFWISDHLPVVATIEAQ